MALWLIHAYENTYGGLHGIETALIVDCSTREDAEEIAIDESYDVMNSYSNMFEDLDEEDREESIAFDVFQIREDCTLSIEELDKLAASDWENVRDKYCDLRN